MFVKKFLVLLSTTSLLLCTSMESGYSMDLPKPLLPTDSPLRGGQRTRAIVAAYGELLERKNKGDTYAIDVLNEFKNADQMEDAVVDYDNMIKSLMRSRKSALPAAHPPAQGASNGISGNLNNMSISDLKTIYHNAIKLNNEGDSSQPSWKSTQFVTEIIRLQEELHKKGKQLSFGVGSSSSSSSSTNIAVVTEPNEIEKIVAGCVEGLEKYLNEKDQISIKFAVENFINPIIKVDNKDWKNFKGLYEVAVAGSQNNNFSTSKQNQIGNLVNVFEQNASLKKIKFIENYRSSIPDPFEELYKEGEEIRKHQYSDKYDKLIVEANPLKILCYIDLKGVTVPDAVETAELIKNYPICSQLLAALHYFKMNGVKPSAEDESASPAQKILNQIVNILVDFTRPMVVTQKEILANADYKKSYDAFPKDPTKRQIIPDPKHSLENFNVLMNLNIQEIKGISQQTLSNIFVQANQLSSSQAKALLYHLATINFFTEKEVIKSGWYYRLLKSVEKDKIMPLHEKSKFLKIMNVYLPKDMSVIQSEIIANVDYKKSYDEFPKDPTKLNLMAGSSDVLENFKVLMNWKINQIRNISSNLLSRLFEPTNRLTPSQAKAILYYLASIHFFTDDIIERPGQYYRLLIDVAHPHVETAEEKRLKDESYKRYLAEKARKDQEDQKAKKEREAEERKQRSAEIKAQRAVSSNQSAGQGAAGAPPPPPPPGAGNGAPPPPPPPGTGNRPPQSSTPTQPPSRDGLFESIRKGTKLKKVQPKE